MSLTHDADTIARRYIHRHGVQAATAYAARLLANALPGTWNHTVAEAVMRNASGADVTTTPALAAARAQVDEYLRAHPVTHATAKFTKGQEVYWGAWVCTIHDVNTMGDKATYLVSREFSCGVRVADRFVGEHELYAVRADQGPRRRVVSN